MDRRTHPSHDERTRMVLLVDPDTHLPVGWTLYDFREGGWEPNQRIDQIEYNVSPAESRFHLQVPPGTRTVDVDQSRRSRARLASQTSQNGQEIVLRAIDETWDGDVFMSLSNAVPGDFVGVDHTPPQPVEFIRLQDDRGTIYVDTWSQHITPAFTMFWLIPRTPRHEGDPWPKRFTITVQPEQGELLTFRDVPAPPPAYESVLEVPPYPDTVMDAGEVETTRKEARARWERIGR
jgi:hypothetical protein